MNAMNPYIDQYKKNQVETATQEQILILLYDGAINYLNRAKIAIQNSDDTSMHSNLLGCEKILIEFMNTLDMEQGGQFAETLYALYRYYYKILITVGISRSIPKLDEVLDHLIRLRDTWQKAIEISNAEKNANLVESSSNFVSATDGYDESHQFNDNSEDEEDEEEDDDGKYGNKNEVV